MSVRKIAIVNGPNLHLVGEREPAIYGTVRWADCYLSLCERYKDVARLSEFQSNSEGAIIDHLHQKDKHSHGIVLNAGAYAHTSLAIADAIGALSCEVVEVHISNVHQRESIRHISLTAGRAKGSIVGLGLLGYRLAIEYFLQRP